MGRGGRRVVGGRGKVGGSFGWVSFCDSLLTLPTRPPPSISSCFAQTTYGRRGGRGEGGGGVRGVGGGVSGCVCVAYLSTRPAANRNDHCLFRFLKTCLQQTNKPRKIGDSRLDLALFLTSTSSRSRFRSLTSARPLLPHCPNSCRFEHSTLTSFC